MDFPVRALAVDDNANWRGILRRNLEEVGFEVHTAGSYTEALERIERQFYHFAAVDLVLDVDPRNQDGLRILEALHNQLDPTVSVLLSAYGRMAEGARAKEIGASEVIDKENWDGMAFQKLAVRDIGSTNARLESMRFGVAFLSSNVMESLWSAPLLRLLRPPDGIVGLDKLTSTLLRGLGPILYKLGQSGGEVHDGDELFTGMYWSKRLDGAIVLVLGTVDRIRQLEETPDRLTGLVGMEVDGVVGSHNIGRAAGIVLRVRNARREAFQPKMGGPIV